jgi:hypothetical protein
MGGFRPIKPPRPPSAGGGARPPSDAPKAPRQPHAGKVNATSLQPFPEPTGYWATRPRTEWVVNWVLTAKLGGKLNVDFLYQVAIPAPGLNVVKGFFRGDFWILPRGRFGGPGPPYTRGIVLDPISLFTHRNAGEDRLRRGILAQGGFLLIWIDDTDLYTRPLRVVRMALNGQDVSSINRGAR